MHKGYLVIIYSVDGSPSNGGFSFYDISNPYQPLLVSRKEDNETQEIREAHGYGYSSSYSGDYVALQAARGIQFWDWTDVTNPTLLSYLILPGITDSNYSTGTWWLSWQAPYVYVGGASNGIYIVEATDPRNPVLVDRNGQPNPIPISRTGGFRIGPIFAVGNLLAATAMGEAGYVTFDIGDPKNPVLLTAVSAGAPSVYSSLVNGNVIYGAGTDEKLYAFDITNPSQFTFIGSANINGRGGYLSFQDGYAHVGASKQYAKVNVSTPFNYVLEGTATSGINNRDEDFATVLGNLVVLSDDHDNGSFIIPHQAQPDFTGPAVNMVVPADGAINQGTTSRIGLTFTDLIDLRTVNNATFIVRPLGGQSLSGKYSGEMGIVNFSPDRPLQPETTYEIVVPANGIKDLAGNPAENTFAARFSTGTFFTPPLACEFDPTAPTEVGQAASFSINPIQGSGSITYTWNFGDGSPGLSTSTPTTSHTYTDLGHYTVQAVLNDGLNTSGCAALQTVHAPLTAEPPKTSSTIILDQTGSRLWNVNPDNDTITAIDPVNLTKLFEVWVGDHPRTPAQAPDSTLWVVNQDEATIRVLDSANGNILTTIPLPYASRPYGIVFSPDNSAAYVTLQGTGQLLKLGPVSRTVLAALDVGPNPRGLAVSGDSSRIFITRYISPASHSEVVEVDSATFNVVRTFQLAFDPGPDGETSGRGVPNSLGSPTISPDGRRLWIPSKKDNTARGIFRDGQALTFESTVRTIVSQIDLMANSEDLAARRDFDNRDMAVAVGFSPVGDYAFVALQGSNAIDVLDVYNGQLITSIENVGRTPQGMVFSSDGGKLFIHSYLSRSVKAYEVSGIWTLGSQTATKLAEIGLVSNEQLPAQLLTGKRIFYNANDTRMNRDGYIACASCHLEGGEDGRVWDMGAIGEGLRNTIALRGRSGMGHGRVHWSANFDEIQDFEHAMRDLFGGTGFLSDAVFNAGRNTPLGSPKAGLSVELDALAAYVASLSQVPPSPYRSADGSLTADAQAGKVLFGQLNCAACHSGPHFTDSPSGVLHNVGTIKATSGQRSGQPLLGLDAPTLRGVWQTAPYLHDGSAPTLLDVLTTANSGGLHGNTASLSAQELQQLVAFLLQIDNLEAAAPSIPPAIKLSSPTNNAAFQPGDIINLAADTANSIGSVTKVEFYADGLLLATDTQAPYTFAWNGTPLGQHIISARAIHNNGITTISSEVKVTVGKQVYLPLIVKNSS
jgi:cytochrome c peroxidase